MWIYVVEVKSGCGWHWERLGQFERQERAVEFSEKARKQSKEDNRESSYRVVPAKLMDGKE